MIWPIKKEIQSPERGRTPHHIGAFPEEIYPNKPSSLWHLIVPDINPQRHTLVTPFDTLKRKSPKEYNILSWPHNLFLFSPVYLCSAKHRESLFLATFSFAPPPRHPVALQGAASQMAGMIPQWSFQGNANTWNSNACINHRHNSHKAAESHPQTGHISCMRALGSRMMENEGQGQDWPCSKTRCSNSAWNTSRI